MIIQMNRVLPKPIKELNYSKSDIWDKTPEFDSKLKYMVKAPSGTGKTTMLSIIYGIRKDYEGSASIDSRNIRDLSNRETMEIRKRKLSIVFQGLQLFPELTAFENIEIKNKLCSTLAKEKIYEYAERLGVAFLMDRKADILSFGQRQRIAVIRALAQPFDFLLLDEPFSHLDSENARLCLELISEVCDANGSGFILTTLGSDYNFQYDKIYNL
jgi:putative ABC transport system ATP-binding protein